MKVFEPVRNAQLKEELVKKLFNENSVWLWSYDLEKVDKSEVPDRILIEKYLLLGSVEDWEKLKNVYERDVLYSHWIENIVPSERYHQKQIEMARFFFDIKDPERFLSKARQQHLANAITSSP
jgi:hypothetical protein